MLLFTDGLVERRGEHLTHSLDRLAAVVEEIARTGTSLPELIGELQRRYLGEALAVEDDTAILGIRMHPEDRPRPPEAGPAQSTIG